MFRDSITNLFSIMFSHTSAYKYYIFWENILFCPKIQQVLTIYAILLQKIFIVIIALFPQFVWPESSYRNFRMYDQKKL